MGDKDIPTTAMNPWHPITDQVDLKHLGKLIEECNELGSAVARCIIQGIDEQDPTSKKPNRQWLEDEIADTMTNIFLVIEHFQLNAQRIDSRASKKRAALLQWHRMA